MSFDVSRARTRRVAVAVCGFMTTCFFLIPGTTPVRADDRREVIVWAESDFAPFSILSGPYKGQGILDRTTEILSKRLPDFQHEIFEAPLPRILAEIKSKPNVCKDGILKTPEREAVMLFSAYPTHWRLPNGVITTRNRLPLFKPFLDAHGELSLDKFLHHDDRRLGIIADRSFGVGIDPVLKKHAGDGSLVVVPSSDHFTSRLLKLANQNEFEAIVGYAVELTYAVRQLDLKESRFVFLPIAEEPSSLPVFIVCSKSEPAKRIMAAINSTLANLNTVELMDNFYRTWLDAESVRHYEKLRRQLTPVVK